MRIRAAKPKDAAICRDLVINTIKKSAVPYYNSEQIEAWINTNTVEQWEKNIKEWSVFIAEDNLGLVAFSNSEIKALYIDKDSIGKGIGKELLRFAEDRINNEINITASLNSVSFYKKQGYETIRETNINFGGVDLPCIELKKIK